MKQKALAVVRMILSVFLIIASIAAVAVVMILGTLLIFAFTVIGTFMQEKKNGQKGFVLIHGKRKA